MLTRGLVLIALVLTVFTGHCFAQGSNARSMKLEANSVAELGTWQSELRSELFDLMKLSDLVASKQSIAFHLEETSDEKRDGYTLKTLSFQSTKKRRITALLAIPENLKDPAPAVVAVHGHSASMITPFNPAKAEYKEFGSALAQQGFIVISVDVGQHDIYEAGRLLMGERLWDIMRCVDFLVSMPQVDSTRIGCAGLSLGGEMTMWLGAMDTRLKATSSCGFLTYMDRMEQNHCMCWKFDGLRDLVDFPDLYAMIAPRALQCQNGLKEPPTQFTVEVAQKALTEIAPAYTLSNTQEKLQLVAHEGGHEINLPALLDFMNKELKE